MVGAALPAGLKISKMSRSRENVEPARGSAIDDLSFQNGLRIDYRPTDRLALRVRYPNYLRD